jgi:phosphatidylglycerol:prolipoprotein diacylglycerol transferase
LIEIDINPVLYFGSVGINWYGFALAMGIVSVIVLSISEAKRVSKSSNLTFNLDSTLLLIVWAIIGGVIGGRLFYIIDNWQYYISQPQEFMGMGIRLIGVMAGVVIAMLIYMLLDKSKQIQFSIVQGADIIAPGSMLGLVVSRIGCFIKGCCYGTGSELPWSVTYLNPMSIAPLGVSIHPVQMYHVIWNLLGFILIWLLRGKLKPTGTLFLLWLAFYAAGDLGIRFLRDDRAFLFSLQQAQFIDIILLAVTIPLLTFRIWQTKRIVTSQ